VRVPALALCGTATATVTATAAAIFHIRLLSSFVDLPSHCKASPGQPGSAAQTCDILGSLQSPVSQTVEIRSLLQTSRTVIAVSEVRTQGSGLRRGVLGPPAHAQLELTLTRTLTAPGRAAHVACSCASRLRVTSGKNLSSLFLSLPLSLSLSSSLFLSLSLSSSLSLSRDCEKYASTKSQTKTGEASNSNSIATHFQANGCCGNVHVSTLLAAKQQA
jgi:hypothetical protein